MARSTASKSKGQRKLATNVYIDGELHAAGTSPDADVAERITNPKAWEAGEDASDSDDDNGDGSDKS